MSADLDGRHDDKALDIDPTFYAYATLATSSS